MKQKQSFQGLRELVCTLLTQRGAPDWPQFALQSIVLAPGKLLLCTMGQLNGAFLLEPVTSASTQRLKLGERQELTLLLCWYFADHGCQRAPQARPAFGPHWPMAGNSQPPTPSFKGLSGLSSQGLPTTPYQMFSLSGLWTNLSGLR